MSNRIVEIYETDGSENKNKYLVEDFKILHYEHIGIYTNQVLIKGDTGHKSWYSITRFCYE